MLFGTIFYKEGLPTLLCVVIHDVLGRGGMMMVVDKKDKKREAKTSRGKRETDKGGGKTKRFLTKDLSRVHKLQNVKGSKN
mmetsp:Transcript_23099/g.35982  ORF Transcript_23099/g.35982 Transcript_23099/m.35982 type:complete len:81 (+) Transcript_23099:794-1036(+)